MFKKVCLIIVGRYFISNWFLTNIIYFANTYLKLSFKTNFVYKIFIINTIFGTFNIFYQFLVYLFVNFVSTHAFQQFITEQMCSSNRVWFIRISTSVLRVVKETTSRLLATAWHEANTMCAGFGGSFMVRPVLFHL